MNTFMVKHTENRFEDDANGKEMYTYTERITPGKAAGIFLVRTNVLIFVQVFTLFVQVFPYGE